MTQLAINKLENNDIIETSIRVESSVTFKAIRLKVFKKGTLTNGVFTLEIYDGASLLGTAVIDSDDLSQITGTYAYGYVNFELPYPVRVNVPRDQDYTELELKLTVSGLTNSESNYLGLIKQHEFKYISEFGTYPVGATTDETKAWYAPYGVELYVVGN